MRKWYQRSNTISRKWLRAVVVLACMCLILVAIAKGAFSLTPSRAANPVIALDKFNRTVTNGWGTANLGGSWTVLDTPANWSVKPVVGSISVVANGQERGVLGNVAVQDVDLLTRITVTQKVKTQKLQVLRCNLLS